MTTSQRTQTRIEDGIAHITLDDGKVNAMSFEMLSEILDALGAAEKEGALVVLRGRAGIFSAGFDLSTFTCGREPTLDMLRAGVRAIERILAFPYPVLTVCTGHAYPMGAFLMLASDVRFGIAGNWRIGLNETAIGLTVPKFAIELARHRLAPQGFVRISTAALFSPEEAMRFGYLDRVLDAEHLDAEVDLEAERLRSLGMSDVTATKSRVNEHVLRAISAAAREELVSPEVSDSAAWE
jgi:enoyl-CoA hydratase